MKKKKSKLELIGWTGGIALAVCGIPQLIQSFQQGHAQGVSWSFLLLWIYGEIAAFIYILPKKHWPLIFNYLFNIFIIAGILYYKVIGG